MEDDSDAKEEVQQVCDSTKKETSSSWTTRLAIPVLLGILVMQILITLHHFGVMTGCPMLYLTKW